MTIPPDGSRPVDPTMQAMIERVQADLAQRLGLEISQISVVEAKAVEWHNSSLGCPQPGTMYAQVITPGYLIVLEVKGSIHEYHTDRGTTTFLCHSLPGLKLPPPKSADDRTPWQPVDSSSSTGTPWQTPNRP